jgi:hypothetical protein
MFQGMLTLIIRKIPIFPLEQEVPNANIGHLKRRVKRVGRHVDDVVAEALMCIEEQALSMRFNATSFEKEPKRRNRG